MLENIAWTAFAFAVAVALWRPLDYFILTGPKETRRQITAQKALIAQGLQPRHRKGPWG